MWKCASGLVTVLREARAAQTIKLAAIKFMVLYQLLLALMFHVAFFMDGSGFTSRQVCLVLLSHPLALSLHHIHSLSMLSAISFRPSTSLDQLHAPLSTCHVALTFDTAVD